MKDSSFFRAGEMRPQWPLSFWFSVIELSRNNPEPEDSLGGCLEKCKGRGSGGQEDVEGFQHTVHLSESGLWLRAEAVRVYRRAICLPSSNTGPGCCLHSCLSHIWLGTMCKFSSTHHQDERAISELGMNFRVSFPEVLLLIQGLVH